MLLYQSFHNKTRGQVPNCEFKCDEIKVLPIYSKGKANAPLF